MSNKFDKMTGIPIGFDVFDEDGNLVAAYRLRCMNCGVKGSRFVPTLDSKYYCCMVCTCIVADLEVQTESDMSGVRWEI